MRKKKSIPIYLLKLIFCFIDKWPFTFWLGTGTSGGVILMPWNQTSPLSEMRWSCKWNSRHVHSIPVRMCQVLVRSMLLYYRKLRRMLPQDSHLHHLKELGYHKFVFLLFYLHHKYVYNLRMIPSFPIHR